MHLCEYGCGQEAKYQFKNGKWCCSKNVQSCLVFRKKISKANIGKIINSEIRKKISNGNKNKYVTLETRKRLSLKNKGQKSWSKNKKFNQNYKKKFQYSIDKLKSKFPIFAKIEEMRYNPNKPEEKEIQVHCKNHNCPNSKEKGDWFTPEYELFSRRVWAIEKDDGNGGNYFYCCEECKHECPLFNLHSDPNKITEELYTSEEYQTFRNEVLKRENYICEYCGEKAIDVHHSRPQKLEPGFVLDPDLGVACCEKCHYKYGHKTGTNCSTGNLANKLCK